mgnify:CR=1 FL=1
METEVPYEGATTTAGIPTTQRVLEQRVLPSPGLSE